MARKILIADDEDMVRELVKTSLRNDGYEFVEAREGQEALNLTKAHMPDLVILDIMMPGMLGYQVCKEIKNNKKTAKIPVLFITARTSTLSVQTAVQSSGGQELINKPFDPADLRARVKKLLGP
jgi:two-component system alkaline phosphatase synthesis response regulator PhoP